MDFGSLPPEVNSARMYAGAGSAPLLAAATAWNSLSAELSSAADTYQTVIAELTDYGWLGPASTAMAAAAAPYAEWMNTTAGQAEQTAAAAANAAGAYEAAYAATVPPAEVAANRAQLAQLVATNILGQNGPAIAAVEALYGQMWAQDATAMYGYAANSAAASKVTPFRTPAQATTGLTAQNAVAQATGSSAGANAQTTLSQLISALPNTLQNFAFPGGTAGSSGSPSFLGGLQPGDITNAITNSASGIFTPYSLAGITQMGADIAVIRGAALTSANPFNLGEPIGLGGPLGGPAGLMTPVPGAGNAEFGLASGLGGSPVSAQVGQATLVGKLAVPQGWTPANQMTTPLHSGAMEFHTVGAPTGEATPGMPGMPGMPMMGSGSRSFSFAVPRYGFRPTVMAQPPAAG